MKIALDGIFLNNPHCGTGQYTYQLIKGLNWLDSENQYFIYSPDDNSLDFALNQNFKWRRVGRPNLGAAFNKLLWEQLWEPLAVKRDRPDLVHIPYMARPVWAGPPTVVTIHDVIGYKFPEYRSSFKWRLYYWLNRRPLQKADQVVTVSEFSKNEINETLNIPAARIKVIYGSADLRLAAGALDNLRVKYGLKRKFILNVSAADPRKNLATLIKAYLQSELAAVSDLVVVNGSPGVREPGVIFLTNLPRADLAGLYQLAEFMVYPSLYEGFGLPVLEAMQSGCPVIAGNSAALPEVVGDAGILVSAGFPEILAETMKTLFENGELRRLLAVRGREQARKFNWLKMVGETLNLYKKIGGAS